MLTLLHGEHHIKSRAMLVELLSRARSDQKSITHIESKQLDQAVLTQALQSHSLFGEERVIVIEELHSLPKSKKRDALLELLRTVQDDREIELVLWEKKQLSATEVKAFPGAKVQAFAPTKTMFTWLGSISGNASAEGKRNTLKLLQDTIKADGEYFCFSMLTRQVRLLMTAKESSVGANPRVVSQAKTFTWKQLFALHHQLVLIDEKSKNSSSSLDMSNQLELLLATL